MKMNATISINLGRSWLATGGKAIALALAAGALLAGAGMAQAQPTIPAPTPTLPQGKVIALYNSSGVYTNVPVGNYFENWYAPGVDGLYAIPATSDSVLSYVGMDCCAGIELGANTISLAGCTNLHVDVFTPNGNNFAIKLVDASGVSAEVIYTPAGAVITNNGWIGLDMPVSQFASLAPTLNLQLIKQVGVIDSDGGGITPADYYIDNVYFSASTNLVFIPPPAIPAPTNNAPTPTQPAGNVLALYNSSGTYPDAPYIDWPASWSGSAQNSFTITNTGNVIENLPGLSYVGEDYYSPDQIDTTPYNTMHIDLWTANGNQLFVQLVSLDNGGTQAAQVGVSNFATNKWVGLDIPLSQFTAATPSLDLTAIQQMLWVDNTGAGLKNANFYFDNVYFYSNALATPPPTATTVYVDPTQNWVGYMNWAPAPNDPSGDGGTGASVWGITALPAVFSGSVLTLSPNVNTYDNTSDSYWVNPDGSGANTMDANFYVENDSLAGQTVTFNGYCDANTLASPYTTTVFIKDFVSNYSSFTTTNIPATPGAFSISLVTAVGDHVQYGFETFGPDANPATVASLGSVIISSNAVAFSPAVTASVSGGNLHMAFSTQNGFTYTVQYKTNLTDSVWQTLSSVSGNGSAQTIPDATTQKSRFYRLYVH